MSAKAALVAVQSLTFMGLAVVFLLDGHWRLAVAQGLLCGVTAALYL